MSFQAHLLPVLQSSVALPGHLTSSQTEPLLSKSEGTCHHDSTPPFCTAVYWYATQAVSQIHTSMDLCEEAAALSRYFVGPCLHFAKQRWPRLFLFRPVPARLNR